MIKEYSAPMEIEARSMEIIAAQLGETGLPDGELAVLQRVIHTTADFDYRENLYFSPGAMDAAQRALLGGAVIVTDTNMAKAGVSKPGLNKLGGRVECFMADEDVSAAAREQGGTRARAAVDKAAEQLAGELILFAVGNAPTALARICELIQAGRLAPALVIGAPVGFVNVVESKQLLEATGVPCIVARGRKGGSNVAAAICNALIYRTAGRA